MEVDSFTSKGQVLYQRLESKIIQAELDHSIQAWSKGEIIEHCDELIDIASRYGLESNVNDARLVKISYAEQFSYLKTVIDESTKVLVGPIPLRTRVVALKYRKDAHVAYLKRGGTAQEKQKHLQDALTDCGDFVIALRALQSEQPDNLAIGDLIESSTSEYYNLKTKLEQPDLITRVQVAISKLLFSRAD